MDADLQGKKSISENQVISGKGIRKSGKDKRKEGVPTLLPRQSGVNAGQKKDYADDWFVFIPELC